MILGAAAALAIALAGAPQPQQWITANRRTIARIHDAKERAARERIFTATMRELEREPAAPAHLVPDAGLVAREILASSRIYRLGYAQKAPPKTWWDELTAWIVGRWRAIAAALFGHVRLSGRASVAAGDLLLGLSIGAFLFLTTRLMWQYARPSAPPTGANSKNAGLQASELFADAERAARDGLYAQSVRMVFMAAVRELQRRGLLREDPSATVGELRRRVHRRDFDVLARVATLALYADAQLGAQDWERARDAYLLLSREPDGDNAA